MKAIRKLLVKDYQNVTDKNVRARYGLSAGIVGIISNTILCVFKLVIGFIGNSITVIADAINNLSDAGSSAVTTIGFKLSSAPPDKDHPFGHARYEYITQLLVAMVILFIGIMLMKSSIEKCITPEVISVTTFTYVVLAVSIVMKLLQMALYMDFAKAIDSGALKASAKDSRNDVIATTAVLISTIVIDLTGVNIDGYMGIVVSLFIIISSLMLLKESVSPILGEKPAPELVKQIEEKILSYDGVIGIHDLVVHNYGASTTFAIVHVEVPACENIVKSHDIIDTIEHDFYNDLKIHLNIHMDPVDTLNEHLQELKTLAINTLVTLDESLTLHDFRIVSGDSHTNVLFDVVVPFESKITKEDIVNKMDETFNTGDTKYFFVIDIDRKMC